MSLQADSYSPLRAFANGTVQGSIIDMQDEEKNTAMKRAVGGVFAVKNLLDYEHDVDEASAALIAKITAVRKFNLSKTLSEFQIDFLRKMAFSYPPSYLKEGKDITDMSATKRVRHWCRWQPTPGLEQLLYKNPYINKLLKRKTPLWILQAIQEWHGRKTSTQVREQKDLLDKYIEGSEKHKDTVSTETIQRLVASTISAGFDTTALTMTSIIYYLIKNPEAAGKLREEVDQAAAIGKLSDPAQYTETDKMEYLSAVIKEAMRCYPFITVLIERVVPAEGAMIAGKFIPGGTVVGCCPEVIHRNRELYGEDADRFRPERWLTEDRDRRIAMERASLGFGSGKRACMGRHIAELEMKKVIPDLLLKFKVSRQSRQTTLVRVLTRDFLVELRRPERKARI